MRLGGTPPGKTTVATFATPRIDTGLPTLMP
jgi:hypothetical protein